MLTSTAVILVLLLIIIALLYSSVGHGGASGYLAAMALLGLAPEVMRPTALALNVLVASIGTVQFARAGHFHWPLFWPFAVMSIPAAAIGGKIQLPPSLYEPLLGAVLLFSAWRLAKIRKPPTGCDEKELHPPKIPLALLVGAALGMLSGLTGTGGGIFLSPLILLCGWATPKQTSAVSAAFILFNSIAGLFGFFTSGATIPDIWPAWIGPFGAAVMVGGFAGSYFGARRLPSLTIRRLLAFVLLIAGTKLIAVW